MSVSVVLAVALGIALVGSLCFLVHTIYRRPTTTTAATGAPESNRQRFPVIGSEPHARNAHAPDSLGEVDDAYRVWLQSLDDINAELESFSTHSSAR